MPQKYKVYINDKVIIFRKSKTTSSLTENQLVFIEPSPKKLKDIISEFEYSYKAKKLFIISSDPKTTFRFFALGYTMVIAAGGIVRNRKGDILFIFRNGKWDLPKGKADNKEKPRKTAIREVMEETGLTDVTITKKLPCTYHTYSENNTSILKKTNWYEMRTGNSIATKPQAEEGITEVRWVEPDEINDVLKNTYSSVFKLVSKYRKENHC
jgi:8-oxo-dGTP pyrophosphatase MutT (NUDIX family)